MLLLLGSAHAITPDHILTDPAGPAENYSFFGQGLAAGDLNGDGYDELLVCARTALVDGSLTGAVYIYTGSAAGPADPVAVVAPDATPGQYFCSDVTAADLNGDGYDDLVVGATGDGGGEDGSGAAYVFPGGPDGVDTAAAAKRTLDGISTLGGAVAAAGDVNGDGFADLMVGAAQDSPDSQYAGSVFVYHGGPDGIAEAPDTTLTGSEPGEELGIALDGAGDLNGDGYGDAVVGTDGEYAWVYFGSGAGLDAATARKLSAVPWPDASSGAYGRSVSRAGDLDADGFADVVIGAFSDDNGGTNSGAVYPVRGGKDALSEDDHIGIPLGNAGFGASISSGDANADGCSDLLVGAYNASSGTSLTGMAYLYTNTDEGLSQTEISPEDNTMTFFGVDVLLAGDFNGDGVAEIVVTAGRELWDAPGTSAVYLYTAPATAGCSLPEDPITTDTAEDTEDTAAPVTADPASGCRGRAVLLLPLLLLVGLTPARSR